MPDRATITIAGTTYYLYGNTFYKRVVTNGQETFVVVTKPAGVVAVKALPEDFGPYHGSNPVVSPDGRFAVVQLGIHGMGAGQGRGLVLVDLAAWERTLGR